MAVEKLWVDREGLTYYAGLSTDTKPTVTTVASGSLFWEIDTRLLYRACAAGWVFSPNSVGVVDELLPLDTRIARFDAAADMPVDITNASNVSGDRITFTGFTSTARHILALFHSGINSWNAAAGAGPICSGARLVVNAPDDSAANSRLTYTDLTGGGSSSSGTTDLVQLSIANPAARITLSAAIARIDAVGIPLGYTPTNIVASFLELRVLG